MHEAAHWMMQASGEQRGGLGLLDDDQFVLSECAGHVPEEEGREEEEGFELDAQLHAPYVVFVGGPEKERMLQTWQQELAGTNKECSFHQLNQKRHRVLQSLLERHRSQQGEHATPKTVPSGTWHMTHTKRDSVWNELPGNDVAQWPARLPLFSRALERLPLMALEDEPREEMEAFFHRAQKCRDKASMQAIVHWALLRGDLEPVLVCIQRLLEVCRDNPNESFSIAMNPKRLLSYNAHLVISALWNEALVDRFIEVENKSDESMNQGAFRGVATDGTYLYIHSVRGLLKMGTGRQSQKGKVYSINSTYRNSEAVHLAFANGHLFASSNRILWPMVECIDPASLQSIQMCKLGVDNRIALLPPSPYAPRLFSDGNKLYLLGQIPKSVLGDDQDALTMPSAMPQRDVAAADTHKDEEDTDCVASTPRKKSKHRKYRGNSIGKDESQQYHLVLYVYDPIVAQDVQEWDEEPWITLSDSETRLNQERKTMSEQLWSATGFRFSLSHCDLALRANSNDMNSAARWLLDHGDTIRQASELPLVRRIFLGPTPGASTTLDIMDRSPCIVTRSQLVVPINPYNAPWSDETYFTVRVYDLEDGHHITDTRGTHDDFLATASAVADTIHGVLYSVASHPKGFLVTSFQDFGPPQRYEPQHASLQELCQSPTTVADWVQILISFLHRSQRVANLSRQHLSVDEIKESIKRLEEEMEAVNMEAVANAMEEESSVVPRAVPRAESIQKALLQKQDLLATVGISTLSDALLYIPFCRQVEPSCLQTMIHILNQLEITKALPSSRSYAMLVMLRLLQDHICDVARCGQPSVLSQEQLQPIQRCLLHLAHEDSMPSDVQLAASETLMKGMSLFYPTATSRCLFLCSLAKDVQSSHARSREFMEASLQFMSKRLHLASYLIGDEVTASFESFLQFIVELLVPSMTEADLVSFAVDRRPFLYFMEALQTDVLAHYAWDLKTVKAATIDVFMRYASCILEHCTVLIEDVHDWAKQSAPNYPNAAQLSVLFDSSILKLLPSLLASLHIDTTVAYNVLPRLKPLLEQLEHLLEGINRLNVLLPFVVENDKHVLSCLLRDFEEEHAFESPHPYVSGRNSMHETITVPGADMIVLWFDSRCGTPNKSDVFHLKSADGVSPSVSLGPFFGNTVSANSTWPREPVVIPGSSVVFSFSARSAPSDDDRIRWGFRILATGIVIPSMNPLYSLQNALVECCANVASMLIRGGSMEPDEDVLNSWLSHDLCSNGLYEKDFVDYNGHVEFIHAFLNNDIIELRHEFCQTRTRFLGRSRIDALPSSHRNAWDRALRCVGAAMFSHSGLVPALISFYMYSQEEQDLLDILVNEAVLLERIHFISDQAHLLQNWMVRQCQVLKLWYFALDDATLTFDSFEREYGHPSSVDELEIMCSQQGVLFLSYAVDDTITRLFARLEEQKAEWPALKAIFGSEWNIMQYMQISQQVSKRAMDLLQFEPYVYDSLMQETDMSDLDAPSLSRSQSSGHHLWDQGRSEVRRLSFETENSDIALQTLGDDLDQPELYRAQSLPEVKVGSPAADRDSLSAMKKTERNIAGFKKRVSVLRDWVGQYKTWRNWQSLSQLGVGRGQSSKSRNLSPIESIVSFVKLGRAANSLVSIATAQRARGYFRLQGLQFLNNVMKHCFCDSLRIHVTRILVPSLLSASQQHAESIDVFRNIKCISHRLRGRIESSFAQFIDLRVGILEREDHHDVLKLYVLADVFGVHYGPQDIGILTQRDIVSTLTGLLTKDSFPSHDVSWSWSYEYAFAKWAAARKFAVSVLDWDVEGLSLSSMERDQIRTLRRSIVVSLCDATLFYAHKLEHDQTSGVNISIVTLLELLFTCSSSIGVRRFVEFGSLRLVDVTKTLFHWHRRLPPQCSIAFFNLLARCLPHLSPSSSDLKTLPSTLLHEIGYFLLNQNPTDAAVSPRKQDYIVVGHHHRDITRDQWIEILTKKCPEAVVEPTALTIEEQREREEEARRLFEERKAYVERKRPRRVDLDIISGSVRVEPQSLLFTSEDGFGTVFGDVGVCGGRWYFEVVLHTAGVLQIGWATKGMQCDSKRTGVGDDLCSWAYDGNRLKKWHLDSGDYGNGQRWKQGDVVGVMVDLEQQCISYSLNDDELGVAFRHIDLNEASRLSDGDQQEHFEYLYPAVSFSRGETAEFIFDREHLRYSLPEGYYPLEGDDAIVHKPDLEKRARRIASAIMHRGFADIVHGSFVSCLEHADKLRTHGALVTMYEPNLFAVMCSNGSNQEYARSNFKRNDTVVYSGERMEAVVSAMIAVYRILMNHSKSSLEWTRYAMDQLYDALDIGDEPQEDTCIKLLSALSILGGFLEPVRVGASVQCEGNQVGIVVDFVPGNAMAHVTFTPLVSDYTPSIVQSISVENMQAISTIGLDRDTIPLSSSVIAGLITMIRRDMTTWVDAEIHWRGLKVLCEFADDLDWSQLRMLLDLFTQLAAPCPLNLRLESASRSMRSTAFTLWNLYSRISPYTLEIVSWTTKAIQVQDTDAQTASFHFQSQESLLGKETGGPHVNKMLLFWEKNIIPRIQDYVRGSFRDYEMEYFFESLRQPLRQQDQEAAIKVAYTLCGGRIPEGVVFPSPDRSWSTLIIEEAYIGQQLYVTSEAPFSASWEQKLMDDVLGRFGCVIAIDPSTESVLLEFYSAEMGSYQYWMFPVDVLKSKEEVHANVVRDVIRSFDTKQSALRRLIPATRHVGELLARRALFNLTVQSDTFLTSQMQSSTADAFLAMVLSAASEVIDLVDPLDLGTPVEDRSGQLSELEQNVLSASQEVPQLGLLDQLLPVLHTMFTTCRLHIHDKVQYYSSASLTNSNVLSIRYPDATALILTWSTDTMLDPNTELQIFADEKRTQLLFAYTGGPTGAASPRSCTIRSNMIWIQRSSPDVGLVKFKLQCIPVYPLLGQALWLHQMLLNQYSVPQSTLFGLAMCLLDAFDVTSLPPCPIKETVVRRLQMVFRRASQYAAAPAFGTIMERMGPLHDEMMDRICLELQLDLYSSYTKRLVDLCLQLECVRPPEQRKVTSFSMEDVHMEVGEEAPAEPGWSCGVCTFMNADHDSLCQICGSPPSSARPIETKDTADQVQQRAVSSKLFSDLVLASKGLSFLLGSTSLKSDALAFLASETHTTLCRQRFESHIYCISNLPPAPGQQNAHSWVTRHITSLFSSQSPPSSADVLAVHYPALGDTAGAMDTDAPIVTFDHSGTDFDDAGLLHYLGTSGHRSAWANPCSRGYCRVSSSSVQSDSKPAMAVLGKNVIRFVTKAEQDSWVRIDLLKGIQVQPSGYSLRHYASWHNEALRHWVLQGSVDDGATWDTLSVHENDASLDKKGATATWHLEHCDSPFYSSFRVMQTAPNSNGNLYLALSGFELFGTARGDALPIRAPKIETQGYCFVHVHHASDTVLDKVDGFEAEWNPQCCTELHLEPLKNMDKEQDRYTCLLQSFFQHDGRASPRLVDAVWSILSEEKDTKQHLLDLLGDTVSPSLASNSKEGLAALLTPCTSSAPYLLISFLEAHGYDMTCTQAFGATLNDTRLALEQWNALPTSTSATLIHAIDLACTAARVTDPIDLSPSSLVSCMPRVSALVCRARLVLLQLVNRLMLQLLPLVHLSANDSWLGSLVRQSRHLLFSKTKMDYVDMMCDKTAHPRPPSSIPSVTLNRIDIATASTIDFLKSTFFARTYQQLQHVDPRLLRPRRPQGAEPFLAFEVRIKGEHVVGEGGPYRQLFTDISRDLLEDGHATLFVPCPNRQAAIGENQDKFVLSPSGSQSSVLLDMCEFLGTLFGCCIRTGVHFALDCPSFFWKPLVGDSLTMEDLEAVDLVTVQVLTDLASDELDEATFAEAYGDSQRFEVVCSDRSRRELIENGFETRVTYENRREFVALARRARLNESVASAQAILRGIAKVVPIEVMNLLSWEEAEALISGKPLIDVEMLRRHTEYSGVDPTAPHIGFFWETLESMTQEQLRKFVRFAWAQERLPSTDDEFYKSHTRFLIKGLVHDETSPDSRFPRADTCFFNLELPAYTSASVLKQRLLFAIMNTHTMNADQGAGDMHGASDE